MLPNHPKAVLFGVTLAAQFIAGFDRFICASFRIPKRKRGGVRVANGLMADVTADVLPFRACNGHTPGEIGTRFTRCALACRAIFGSQFRKRIRVIIAWRFAECTGGVCPRAGVERVGVTRD